MSDNQNKTVTLDDILKMSSNKVTANNAKINSFMSTISDYIGDNITVTDNLVSSLLNVINEKEKIINSLQTKLSEISNDPPTVSLQDTK